MSETIVLYSSRYGAARQYAHMMAEELGRGAWDESAMSFKDRTLCRMLQKAVAKKDPASCEPWETALLEASGRSCSWIDKKYLEPVPRDEEGTEDGPPLPVSRVPEFLDQIRYLHSPSAP